MTNQYKKYISALKGFACIFVMIGHYLGIIKYAERIPINVAFFDFLGNVHLDFLVNESFWLQLFFVISGYLCAHSAVKNFGSFIIKSVCRFLRLAIPIFFANCLILVIFYVVGFHNMETVGLFENSWFQGAYATELNIALLLRSPFDTLIASKCLFNSPYWVLRDMFFASICIYLLLYIKTKIQTPVLYVMIYMVFLCGSFLHSSTIFACLVGSVLTLYEEKIDGYVSVSKKVTVLVCCLLLYVLIENYCVAILLFSASIIFFPKIKSLNKFLELKVFDYIGKSSFGIYSFHWPIICSVGSVLILLLNQRLELEITILIALLLSMFITILLSIIYSVTAEKWSAKIVACINTNLQNVLK